MQTPLDLIHQGTLNPYRGERLGLVCNQASIAADYTHSIEVHKQHNLRRIFGPQHGLFGHTQDNMIEWEGTRDPRTGLEIVSLYGEHRQPTPAMLADLDRLVIDLPDVGARYYTFIWTMALCLKACEPLGLPVTVLDRPNPIGGTQVEGPLLEPEYASFVGLYPLRIRHGMTIGEVARHLVDHHFPRVDLTVLEMQGWERPMYFDDTGLPWAMPSPNMPTLDTAIVYPGGCLLEGTNLSEGRGTTRPFEIFGAPWLDAWKFCDALNASGLEGCHFRPYQFQPTFHKFAGELCEGAFLHVTNRQTFKPFLSYLAVLQTSMRQAPNQFAWKQPPYEYETEKLPIDILLGNSWLRHTIESGAPLPLT